MIKVPLDGLQREVMPFFFDSQTNIRDTLRHSIQPKENTMNMISMSLEIQNLVQPKIIRERCF